MELCSRRMWWRQGACAARSITPASCCWTAHLSTKRGRTRPMWRLRRRRTGKLTLQRRQCMSPFKSVHRVIHLMRGLPVISLLFILIPVACGMFLVFTLLDVCVTAVLPASYISAVHSHSCCMWHVSGLHVAGRVRHCSIATQTSCFSHIHGFTQTARSNSPAIGSRRQQAHGNLLCWL